MKLLGRSRQTDQSLKEAVDAAGGALDIRVSQLMRNHGFTTPAPNATAHVERALSRAGLRAVPPLPGRRWDESIRVVVNGAEATVAPTADEVQPEADVQPEPEMQPEAEAPLEAEVQPEENIEQVMDESIALAQGEVTEEATDVPDTQVAHEAAAAEAATELAVQAANVIAADDERRMALHH